MNRAKKEGRPTKYDHKYCEKLIDFARRTGKPFSYFGPEIGVCRATLHNWAREHPDFLDAKKRANELAAAFMFDLGMRAAQGKVRGFNMGAFAMIMKNCHGWRDNPDPPEEEMELIFD